MVDSFTGQTANDVLDDKENFAQQSSNCSTTPDITVQGTEMPNFVKINSIGLQNYNLISKINIYILPSFYLL